MGTKQRFNSLFKTKKIQIILLLSLLFVTLMAYGMLRNTDDLITHKQANTLFTNNKIKKIIIDGEYIHLKNSKSRI